MSGPYDPDTARFEMRSIRAKKSKTIVKIELWNRHDDETIDDRRLGIFKVVFDYPMPSPDDADIDSALSHARDIIRSNFEQASQKKQMQDYLRSMQRR